MRSLLFVPGDSPRKLARALACGADALILDLEDSIALNRKAEARRATLAFLRQASDVEGRPALYVRINGSASGLSEADLDMIMTAGPDGLVLPKACGGGDVALLDSRLAVREALHGFPDGQTRILAIVTETAAALFAAGSYAGSSPRLAGMIWGVEGLSAEVGAEAARIGAELTPPFQLARSLCLFGAAAAGVAAIDAATVDFQGTEALRKDCAAAARDGFSGKLAIHPDQVPVINAAFVPSPEAVARAERIVTAFAEAGGAGVTALEGAMLDRPHLKAAERLLERLQRMPR